MAKDKKSFLIYCDIIKSIDHFTNEEKGILFQHLLEYVNDMNPVLTDRLILTAWKPIENQLKRDLQKYESVRKRNSENALKRWGKKDTKECDRIESDTKSTRNADNDTDNDTDKDISIKIDNSNYKKIVLSDSQFMEITAMQTKTNFDTVIKYLDEYENHLIRTSEQKKNIKDFKSHFTNWINRQDIKKVIKHVKQRYV